ncbi:chemotaxis protein CheB [Dyella telluris]|uniref:protein-glutamate methylesterase n=1 Tax=Dyella telluris TaxID=2763498 RepID=A0A7G8Q0L9_9GAMM|nr:chemotaxis protein CheB [Dyella telluris]QNK00327.1 chemotaxis protein CheB [Dyella telluris]
MAEAATAVALLFDDLELGGQLREALRERGARIVHEGALSTLSRQMIDTTGAEVLVVNLDEDAEDDIDRLYDVIDGDRPRVVFNDAAASRSLDGWDRARWARHLAVKVMAQGDLDPPRPHDAPAVPEAVATPLESIEVEPPVQFDEPATDFVEPVAVVEPQVVHATEEQSESLAAELEALLAADEPVADAEHASPVQAAHHDGLDIDDFEALKDVPLEAEDDFGSGLKFSAEDELPALHDGDFGAFAEEAAKASEDVGSGLKFGAGAELPPLHDGTFGLDTLATQGPAPLEEGAAKPVPSFQLDHLELAPLDESLMPVAATAKEGSSSLMDLALGWSLVDEDETPPPIPELASAPAHPKEFGVEKLSAQDFLAPEGGEEEASIIEPGMKLELVSMEEALAPREYEGGNEMLLGELDGAIGRLLVLGAASDSLEAVCSFLSMLPTDLRAAVLHVQHLGGKSVEALSDTLTRHSELPVRVAAPGVRARVGEVLVVPAGQQARVHRDGRVDLQPLENNDMRSSPIDASFTMAANVFGRHAQAIVFAGQANDALGGCQAIHDRGGQVWIESSDGHYVDMVHGIEAERLHSYSGTPAELAARLVEEMSMEGRR